MVLWNAAIVQKLQILLVKLKEIYSYLHTVE